MSSPRCLVSAYVMDTGTGTRLPARLAGSLVLAFAAAGNWNSLRYYLYVFCNCGEQRVPTFKSQMMRGKNSPSRRRVLEFCFEIESFRS